MKILAYALMVLLTVGCQQNRTSSNSDYEGIDQEVSDDSTKVLVYEPEDKEEVWYKSMFGKDFAASNFTTIDNEEINEGDLRGKVVFLNFWYKKCPPCIAEMEGLQELHKKYASDKSVFLMVTWENAEIIQAIQHEYDLSYKMVSVDKDSISKWGIRGFPSSIVLNSSGTVVYARVGAQDIVEKATEEVMKKFGPVIAQQLELIN